MTTIINFKDTKDMKQAVRIASAKMGYASSSEMIKALLRKNKAILNELENISKKSSK